MSGDGVIIPAYATSRDRFLAEIESQLGMPVLWGAKEGSATDCSGSVTRAFKAIGGPDYTHTKTAQGLYLVTRELMPIAELPIPGDLAFYGYGPTSVIHVATVDRYGGVVSADGATPSITSLDVAMANPANRVRRHAVVNFRRDTPFVVVHRNTIADHIDLVTR